MDSRRRSVVIGPKVRQVGFVTPNADIPGDGSGMEKEVLNLTANSPTPVTIVPTRPVIEVPQKTEPVAVPSPSTRRPVDVEIPSAPAGSYNPADPVLEGSSLPSSKGGSTINEGYSVASEGAAESSPLGKPGTTTVGFSERVKHKASDPTIATVPAEGGVPGGKPVKGSKVSNQAIPALAGVDSKSSGAPPADGSKPLKERTSKAERRAKQEADRAAKQAAREGAAGTGAAGGDNSQPKNSKGKKDVVSEKKGAQAPERKGTDKSSEKEKKMEVPAPRLQFDDKERVAKAKRRSLVEQTETKNRVELFRHLPQFVYGTQLPSLEAKFFQDCATHPHPAVYKVGLQYLTGDIVGGNSRCVAMLMALRSMIMDYETPAEKTLVRDLVTRTNNHVNFLISCRPLSISMGNAIRFLKARIAKLDPTLPEVEAKANLVAQIDAFMQEKIVFADKEIIKHAVTKIRDGDVVLTHGYSSIVEMILVRAKEMGKKFRVVIIDSRPKLEGRRLLRSLLSKDIHCTYTHTNATSYIMQEVTRVFLGAASVLANGTVYSRVGTACVAMVAHAYGVPVMICCETYKFHERVQLDSITSNELGDPDALVKVAGWKESALVGWAENDQLQLLNLTYDATPADYVSMIITELGMVPPTSVPVILREYRKEPTL
ncbi:hypothetical protein KC19_11G130500 [Ceratodon purpureus]|uniref:Translation initiation factor eIF2B subunit delta n=1 Tax=Ceratodon purpureus TaxID=3225 RepID=A0A8T0GK24_CERPU|nr:hypothetical protein KC19_11G130500 [Ceratodon purpureus]